MKQIISENLPIEARLAGMELLYKEYHRFGYPTKIAVSLEDSNRLVVHEWDYVPSLTEVREKALEESYAQKTASQHH